jgi:hypothetical protein
MNLGIGLSLSGVMGGLLNDTSVTLYTISGTVYDADGSTAVSGATVALGALSATSAANGTYTISSVPAGTSGSMTCTKAGYSWSAITVAAMAANLTSQNYTNAWWGAGGCANKIAAAYQFVGAASQAVAYLRIAGSAGNANLDPAVVGGTAPTWNTTDGMIFDSASSQYLITGVLPGSAWSSIERHANVTGIGTMFGSFTNAAPGVSRYSIAPTLVTDVRYSYGVGSGDKATTVPTGVLGMAGNKAYRNGVDEGLALPAWTGINPTNSDIYIGANHSISDGVPSVGGFLSGKVQALAFWNDTITDDQMAAVYAAIAALP